MEMLLHLPGILHESLWTFFFFFFFQELYCSSVDGRLGSLTIDSKLLLNRCQGFLFLRLGVIFTPSDCELAAALPNLSARCFIPSGSAAAFQPLALRSPETLVSSSACASTAHSPVGVTRSKGRQGSNPRQIASPSQGHTHTLTRTHSHTPPDGQLGPE